MKNPDVLEAAEPVARAFDKLGVHYCIGGSVASSAYGIPRATMDIDMMSDLRPYHISSLVGMLEPLYYIDENMVLEAVEQSSSFNIIHLETMLKIDIFITKNSPFEVESFKRTRKDTLSEEEDALEFHLVSPEDIVLYKLAWFRSGGCVSDQQWKDILGVLKVQQKTLDWKYLRLWALELAVDDLLENAFLDAGVESGRLG